MIYFLSIKKSIKLLKVVQNTYFNVRLLSKKKSNFFKKQLSSKISKQKELTMWRKKKVKRKKKWRFWRLFKRFFLGSKRKQRFKSLSWAFNEKRILWKQLKFMYGNILKQHLFKSQHTKRLFGSRFFFLLSRIECQLNRIVFRSYLAPTILKSNYLIKNRYVFVNGCPRHCSFFVQTNDLILNLILNHYLRNSTHSKYRLLQPIKWKKWQWRKWRWLRKKLKYSKSLLYWGLRKNFIFNYFEVGYRHLMLVLLRNPIWGEILVDRKKKFVTSSLLKKIFLLF